MPHLHTVKNSGSSPHTARQTFFIFRRQDWGYEQPLLDWYHFLQGHDTQFKSHSYIQHFSAWGDNHGNRYANREPGTGRLPSSFVLNPTSNLLLLRPPDTLQIVIPLVGQYTTPRENDGKAIAMTKTSSFYSITTPGPFCGADLERFSYAKDG